MDHEHGHASDLESGLSDDEINAHIQTEGFASKEACKAAAGYYNLDLNSYVLDLKIRSLYGRDNYFWMQP